MKLQLKSFIFIAAFFNHGIHCALLQRSKNVRPFGTIKLPIIQYRTFHASQITPSRNTITPIQNHSVQNKAASKPLAILEKQTHRFKTADQTPQSAKFQNDAQGMRGGIYRFAPFNHLYTFTEKLNDSNFTHIYVGSENSIPEDNGSKSAIKNLKQSIEKKDISYFFGKLSLNAQYELKRRIIYDASKFSDDKIRLLKLMPISYIMSQLQPSQRAFYEYVITDLAVNKPSLIHHSVESTFQFSHPAENEYYVTKFKLYINASQSWKRHFISHLIETPKKGIEKLLALPASIKPKNTTNTPEQRKKMATQNIFELLNVDETVSTETLETLYHEANFTAEQKGDVELMQLLTNAYNKHKLAANV